LLTEREQKLYEWAIGFVKRFPKWADSRLIKGFYLILGPGVSACLLQERSLFHLKRLLLNQFLLQKKIESSLAVQKKNFLSESFQ
jgi:hypothetical protein